MQLSTSLAARMIALVVVIATGGCSQRAEPEAGATRAATSVLGAEAPSRLERSRRRDSPTPLLSPTSGSRAVEMPKAPIILR